jgi:hypothetical protein
MKCYVYVFDFLFYRVKYVLGIDHMSSGKAFDLDSAVKQFKIMMRPKEDLLKADLVRQLHLLFLLML